MVRLRGILLLLIGMRVPEVSMLKGFILATVDGTVMVAIER